MIEKSADFVVPERTTLPADDQILNQWQMELLPYMKLMIVGFAVFFFIASLFQLYYIHQKINAAPNLNLGEYLNISKDGDELEVSQWNALAKLEEHALVRRYHQANVSLMSNIWIKYLGFLTGMVITLCGAVFILGKINVDSSNLANENTFTGKTSLQSSSPGLFLVLMGTILIITTTNYKGKVDVVDGPGYINMYPAFHLGITDDQTKAVQDFKSAQKNENDTTLPP